MSTRKTVLYGLFAALFVLYAATSHAGENPPVAISVLYYSQSGNTGKMAEVIVEGINRVEGVKAKAFGIDAIDEEYVKNSKCVIVGTPTHMADMAPAVKTWFVESARKYGLAGKIGGVFATANYYHGGSELAMQGMATQMLVLGMLVHSGGGAYGVPIIHIGPAAFGGKLEESEELFLTYGERMALKTIEIFK